eukprot:410195-Amphidinium_carterae.1
MWLWTLSQTKREGTAQQRLQDSNEVQTSRAKLNVGKDGNLKRAVATTAVQDYVECLSSLDASAWQTVAFLGQTYPPPKPIPK